MPMATQLDVARLAHVSYMTVSRVVNNQPNVRQATRERVLKAIRELSYYPNAAARILSGRRTNSVGIIFPEEEFILTRPYFVELSVLLEQELSERGYHLFLGSVRKQSQQPGIHHLIAEKKVDGLILFAPAVDDPNIRLLSTEKVPFVIVHGRPKRATSPFVDSDNAAGTRSLLKHLASLGHRRIGFVAGNLKELNARDRLAAYRRFLPTIGVEYCDGYVSQGDWSLESGYRAFESLSDLKVPPTAIVFSNDEMALGGMKLAHDRGISIPDDVSFAGYDDIKYASFVSPPLTTVRQATGEIARAAVDLVLDAIVAGIKPQKVVLKPELVIRASTGPAKRVSHASRRAKR